MNGIKYDGAKPRTDLLPPLALLEVAEVLSYGAKRYSEENWRNVLNAESRYYAAALRHLLAWKSGEMLDPDSGLRHLAHAACSLLFILELEVMAVRRLQESKNE